MTCLTPGCHRVPRPGYARCEACHTALLLSDATTTLSGRPGASLRRMGVRPLPEITESELRFLFGDR